MKTQQDTTSTTILIVDDQPVYIQALSNLLRGEYHIRVAANGPKALEIAGENTPPALILLDIEMPGMEGYEVCRRLKENERTNAIPVIFVTARDKPKDEEMGFNLGAVDYISKPFQPSIVRARVRTHMNLKKKTDLLEKLAMLDGLTDIPNRRQLENRLAEEYDRALRNGRPLSLLMMDIDHFKAYNDNYGHGAGDECLRRVARALVQTLSRSSDLAARYGGEEFAALLPETDVRGAFHLAGKIRAAVADLGVVHDYSNVAPVITLSIGVAAHAVETPKQDIMQLLHAADQALYLAKKEGRNRVRVDHGVDTDP